MAANLPLPPPGFDDLPLDDQIDYVQSLWDRIVAKPDQVPVPDWHRQVVRQRMSDQETSPSEGRLWEEVREETRNKLGSRRSQGR